MDFSEAFSCIEDSIVRIEISVPGGTAVGSGTIFRGGEHCLTCAHVLPIGAKAATLVTSDAKRHQVALLDRDDTLDLAILDSTSLSAKGVPIATERLRIGQECFLVGFPMSVRSVTASAAHISGFDGGDDQYRLDASINHGNSGGPLFNPRGELVGTVNAKHGSLSQFLQAVRDFQPGASMSVGGLDPVQAIKSLIKEMELNLNLGIGYAIPVDIATNRFVPLRKALRP